MSDVEQNQAAEAPVEEDSTNQPEPESAIPDGPAPERTEDQLAKDAEDAALNASGEMPPLAEEEDATPLPDPALEE